VTRIGGERSDPEWARGFALRLEGSSPVGGVCWGFWTPDPTASGRVVEWRPAGATWVPGPRCRACAGPHLDAPYRLATRTRCGYCAAEVDEGSSAIAVDMLDTSTRVL
jgi:hypothetical protein